MLQVELFERGENAISLSPTRPLRRSRAPAHESHQWQLLDHICRSCGGRLVAQPSATQPGATRYLCTNCESEAHGDSARLLCFCGLRLPSHGPRGGHLDPGVRCHRNEAPSAEFPSAVVASEASSRRVNDS